MTDSNPPGRAQGRSLEPVGSLVRTEATGTPAVEVIPARGGMPAPRPSVGIPQPDLGEFEAMFQFAPLAMVLLDPSRVVCRLNRAACRLAGTTVEVGLGLLPGAMLCCAHLEPASGCGLGPRCEGCGLRRLIEETFASQGSFTQVEADAAFATQGRIEQRRLRLSSAYLLVRREPRTLLCIEDITDQALPPGADRAALQPRAPA